MARSKSSKRWLQEHFSDPYVKKAQQAGLRSRAAYKLIEIQKKDKILKKGMIVVDLGAAPGGWSEAAVKMVGKEGKLIALDILPMQPIAGVDFIQGDFTSQAVQDELLKQLEGKQVDVVISDIAPNTSGIAEADQARAMYFTELVIAFAKKVLKPGGILLTKTFQGAGFDELLKDLRKNFASVKIRKPDSSRARSKELYIVARLKAV